MMGCDANDSQSIHLDVWSWGWGGEEGAGEEGGDTDARVKLLHCVAVCYHGNTMQKENIAHCQPATPPPSQFASVVWFLLSSPSRHACQYHLDPRKETRSLTLRDERTAFKGRLYNDLIPIICKQIMALSLGFLPGYGRYWGGGDEFEVHVDSQDFLRLAILFL